jgi:hypothetical protein
MKIKILYNESDYILINLFKETSICRWYEHFNKTGLTYKQNSYRHTKFSEIFKSSIESDWSTIKKNISILDSNGIKFEGILPTKFDQNQLTLNLIHRFFTFNMIHNPSYQALLTPINSAVHRLEWNSIFLYNKQFVINNHLIHPVEYTPTNNNNNTWFEFTNIEQQQNYRYFDYNQKYLVLLNGSILGKSLFTSFIDHDDPTQFDCTGRLGSFGGFVIDVNTERTRIYNSNQFNEWLSSYNISNTVLPLEFPIGYVEDFSKSVAELTSAGSFNRVEFI